MALNAPLIELLKEGVGSVALRQGRTEQAVGRRLLKSWAIYGITLNDRSIETACLRVGFIEQLHRLCETST
jgi:hypothetical protein